MTDFDERPTVHERKGQAFGNNAKHAASDLAFGEESPSRRMVTTNADAPLPMCSCPMVTTSITRWSSKAGAGGIENMRRGDTVLEGLEDEAQEAREGLWADPHSVQERPG